MKNKKLQMFDQEKKKESEILVVQNHEDSSRLFQLAPIPYLESGRDSTKIKNDNTRQSIILTKERGEAAPNQVDIRDEQADFFMTQGSGEFLEKQKNNNLFNTENLNE